MTYNRQWCLTFGLNVTNKSDNIPTLGGSMESSNEDEVHSCVTDQRHKPSTVWNAKCEGQV